MPDITPSTRDARVYIVGHNGLAGSAVWRVSAGDDVTIHELAGAIAEVVGIYGANLPRFVAPDGTPTKLLDVSRINSLGWKARISLEAGQRTTYQWYAEDTHRES